MKKKALEAVWLAALALPPLARGGESPLLVALAALTILAAYTFWAWFRLERARPVPEALSLPLVAGLGLAVVSTATSVHRVTSIWELSWWLALVALFRIVQAELPGPRGLARLQGVLIAVAALVAAYGLLETLVGSDELLGTTKTAYQGQVSGTYVNPSHMASYLVLAWPAAIIWSSSAPLPALRIASGAAAVLIGAAILFSHSRGGWLATAAGAIALWLMSVRSAAMARVAAVMGLVVAALCLVLVATPEALPALSSRLATLSPGAAQGQDAYGRAGPWGAAWQLAQARPVTGWGPGTYAHAFLAVRPPGYYFRPSHAHQELLELGVELGLSGLALSCLCVLAFAHRALRVAGKVPQAELLPHAALVAGGVAFLCTCLWDWPLHVPSTALAAAVLAGALASPSSAEASGTSLPQPILVVLTAVAALAAVPLAGRAVAEARLIHARSLARAGERLDALAAFASVRARWPSLYASALEEVELAQVTGDPAARAQAAQAALDAARAAPELSDTWRALGGALIGIGQYDLAIACFARASELDPANHLPVLERANTLWAVGRHQEADAAYRATLDLYPVDRIGQFPEIVNQMTPVATALSAPDARALPPAVVPSAMKILEQRKARAPRDFRTYRLIQDLYRRLSLPDEVTQEQQAEARAVGP